MKSIFFGSVLVAQLLVPVVAAAQGEDQPPLPPPAPVQPATPPPTPPPSTTTTETTMETSTPPAVYVPAGTAPERRRSEAGMTLFLVDYSVAIPVGGFTDHVNNVSFRGINFEARHFLLSELSVGLGGGWQLFDEKKSRSTYPIENGAVTATLYNAAEIVPLRGTVHVYSGKYGPAKPYAGIGLGASSAYFQTLAADLAATKQKWYFTLTPEIGCLFAFDKRDRSYGLNLSARYTWLPATFGRNVSSVQTISFQAGIFAEF